MHDTVLSLLQVRPSAMLLVDCMDACKIGTLLTIKSAAVTVAVPVVPVAACVRAPSTFETWGAFFFTESLEFGERVSMVVEVAGRSEEVVRPDRTWYFKICFRCRVSINFTSCAVIIINYIIINSKKQLTS